MTEFHVDELHTTVETISGESLLAPDVLARIVAEVRAALAAAEQSRRSFAADIDLRTVVQQQRSGRW
jgi:hypothetical protein